MGKIKENHIGSMDFSVYMEGVSVILQQGGFGVGNQALGKSSIGYEKPVFIMGSGNIVGQMENEVRLPAVLTR